MAYHEKINQTTECTYFEGEIPIKYRYTFGIAGESYYKAIKQQGKILGARCPKCGISYVPPRIYCERCFSELDKPAPVKAEGEIYSYTISHVKLKGEPNPEGRALVLVRFDGYEGGVIAEFRGKREDLRIGRRVKLSFKPKNQRTGSPNDIFAVPA